MGASLEESPVNIFAFGAIWIILTGQSYVPYSTPKSNPSQEGLSNRINPLAKGVAPAIVLPPYYGRDTGIAKLAGAAPLKEERHRPIWLFQCRGYSGVTAGATPISL